MTIVLGWVADTRSGVPVRPYGLSALWLLHGTEEDAKKALASLRDLGALHGKVYVNTKLNSREIRDDVLKEYRATLRSHVPRLG